MGLTVDVIVRLPFDEAPDLVAYADIATDLDLCVRQSLRADPDLVAYASFSDPLPVPFAVYGNVVASLGVLTGSATGQAAVSGVLDRTLADVGTVSTGTAAVGGGASVGLGDVGATGAGAVAVVGAAASTLGSLGASSSANAPITGVVSTTLDALTMSASGFASVSIVADITLASLVVSSSGSVAVVGDVGVTLDALALSCTGAVESAPTTGTFAQMLDTVGLVATGTVLVSGSVTATLEGVLSIGSGGGVGVPLYTTSTAVSTPVWNHSVSVPVETRLVYAGTRGPDMSIATFEHAIGADLSYEIRWDQHDTDPITSETFEVLSGPGSLSVSTMSPDGKIRRFRATGGIEGRYVIKHSVTFTSATTDSRTVVLRCVER